MTPTQIEEAARNKYNAIGSTFFSQDEIMDLIYEACLDLAIETNVIERTYTTSTVAGTQEYAYPTNTLAIKRVTWNGIKLQPIDFRQDDQLTGNNAASTAQGNPQYYAIWNETIILRPIPDSVQTLKVYSVNEPQAVTNTSTLEVPSVFHMGLVNYVVAEMAAKDSQADISSYYLAKWNKVVNQAKRWVQKRKRSDGFAMVKDEETSADTILGIV